MNKRNNKKKKRSSMIKEHAAKLQKAEDSLMTSDLGHE
jgi:hypothetical protein